MIDFVVSLGTRFSGEVSLQKSMPDQLSRESFRSLLDYLVDPKGDDLNPAYEDRDELQLADRIRYWLQEGRKDELQLSYVQEGDSVFVGLQDSVRDHVEQMFVENHIEVGGRRYPYRRADLTIDYVPQGGCSLCDRNLR